ncbi:MAG: hypothetical protein CSA62_02205 [Planctomycetota bacterium]|nr:MAG: hypothetical protein CSA62_02205 [Planctomycetota bacterium]
MLKTTLVFAAFGLLLSASPSAHGVSLQAKAGSASFAYSWASGSLSSASEASVQVVRSWTTASGTTRTQDSCFQNCFPDGSGDGENSKSFDKGDTIQMTTMWFDSEGTCLGTAGSTLTF